MEGRTTPAHTHGRRDRQATYTAKIILRYLCDTYKHKAYFMGISTRNSMGLTQIPAMWNYDEDDTYITFKHLRLIMQWYEQVDKKTSLSAMIFDIKRSGCQYIFYITTNSSGHEHHFRIDNDEVIDLGVHNFWMS